MATKLSVALIKNLGGLRPLANYTDRDRRQALEKETISGQTSTKWARHQDILTVSDKVTLIPKSCFCFSYGVRARQASLFLNFLAIALYH
jgi:hypothetical protein